MSTINEEFNFQTQFATMMKGSKTASTESTEGRPIKLSATRITEMINGVLVSRPLEKVEYLDDNGNRENSVSQNQSTETTTTMTMTNKEPIIVELGKVEESIPMPIHTPLSQTQGSKGGSISNSDSNKAKMINDFINQ